ncbi:hypothetical protein DFH08DRAFT_958224 [Mycena albidolilacea]|uniref:Uncharacterized protein n=1 Tax=Mycena albidolilacea TaxID=1033008 RepID=A0AAD7A6H4_9AGAR|nr:hypothetical protein DFH08DRAFT_958224 [Mycena albidolilacea]
MFSRLAVVALALLTFAAATPAPIDEGLQPIIAYKNNIGFVNPPTTNSNAGSRHTVSGAGAVIMLQAASRRALKPEFNTRRNFQDSTPQSLNTWSRSKIKTSCSRLGTQEPRYLKTPQDFKPLKTAQGFKLQDFKAFLKTSGQQDARPQYRQASSAAAQDFKLMRASNWEDSPQDAPQDLGMSTSRRTLDERL